MHSSPWQQWAFPPPPSLLQPPLSMPPPFGRNVPQGTKLSSSKPTSAPAAQCRYVVFIQIARLVAREVLPQVPFLQKYVIDSLSYNKDKHIQYKSPVYWLCFCVLFFYQNVLLRRGISHQQNIALPEHGHLISKKIPFQRSHLWGTVTEAARLQYDIFCCHVLYNQEAMEAVMGTRDEGVAYISILRNPTDQFISMWDYYDFSRSHGGITLEEYILQNKGYVYCIVLYYCIIGKST